jgi:hypothetical protein
MSATLQIVLEKETHEIGPFVNGKTLSRVQHKLAKMADQLGVQPLMKFWVFSQSSG